MRRAARLLAPLVAVAGVAAALSSCGGSSDDSRGASPPLLSAFFGLDNALPGSSAGICPQAPGLDGIVVNVSLTLDNAAVRPDQWVVVTKSGARNVPVCASLLPANDPGERRTVLLVGNLGSAEDPPRRIEVPDGLPTANAKQRASTRRASFEPVAPLTAGPRLVIAERVAKPTLGGATTGPDGCPLTTKQVLRVAWEGGITRAAGGRTTNADAKNYRVEVEGEDGSRRTVSPTALADVNDFDNYHELCLATRDRALIVRARAGAFVDPNGDPNPATAVRVPTPVVPAG